MLSFETLQLTVVFLAAAIAFLIRNRLVFWLPLLIVLCRCERGSNFARFHVTAALLSLLVFFFICC